MSVSRRRPKGVFCPFGLAVFALGMMPSAIGHQDLVALIASQPAVTARWRTHVSNSPFGTIHAATFSFPQPVGTGIPDPLGYQLANFDPRGFEVTGSISGSTRLDPFAEPVAPIEFPVVDRTHKGDLLIPRRRPALPPEEEPKAKPRPDRSRDYSQTEPAAPPAEAEPADDQPFRGEAAANTENGNPNPPKMTESAEIKNQLASASADAAQERQQKSDMPDDIVPDRDAARSSGQTPLADEPLLTDEEPGGSQALTAWPIDIENPTMRMARLIFGAETLSPLQDALVPWRPGEAPILAAPRPPADPDIKLSALTRAPMEASSTKQDGEKAGETVAAKGEVTGAGKRPKTPAERLGLTGNVRAKHERCLINAIYFEARGESEHGQMAVAQVVMNRVFSGYYPDNICGVVYQNAHRHLACQFTFACDGIRDVVTEPEAWEIAKRIARDTLDGKIWLPEVGKATHYHAYWVRPSWIHEMKKMLKLGVHTFYRPRAWGDGANEPAWGPVPAIANAAGKPSVAAARL